MVFERTLNTPNFTAFQQTSPRLILKCFHLQFHYLCANANIYTVLPCTGFIYVKAFLGLM